METKEKTGKRPALPPVKKPRLPAKKLRERHLDGNCRQVRHLPGGPFLPEAKPVPTGLAGRLLPEQPKSNP